MSTDGVARKVHTHKQKAESQWTTMTETLSSLCLLHTCDMNARMATKAPQCIVAPRTKILMLHRNAQAQCVLPHMNQQFDPHR